MKSIRWYFAEMLLSWALDIAPHDAGRDDLEATLYPFWKRQIGRIVGDAK